MALADNLEDLAAGAQLEKVAQMWLNSTSESKDPAVPVSSSAR
jgi:hypothetical protein